MQRVYSEHEVLIIKHYEISKFSVALKWLRKHPHVHHEITEMQEEKAQQQHTV